MAASEYCTITVTTDTLENATLITQTLLEKRLVACVQSHSVQSAYRWQGKIITTEEIRLDLKTKVTLFDEIKMLILELHTYDVPEILMFHCDGGNGYYFQWIEEETKR
ncbi:MAG TPA: divalent-cation tolerance protein CutA [Epsilonproteobacteria bacterium]|nr:divalent-cation tolerance protein CutA [Campylobacterota bacterium]